MQHSLSSAPPRFDAFRIPRELRALPQWVVYRIEHRGGKATKVPYRADARGKAKSDSPATWATFQVTQAACERDESLAGIGFMFSAEDPYVGIDLDHCVENGELAVWAREMMRDLWSYSEWSRSGDGIHIIARGKLNARGNKRAVQGANRADAAIEMYDHGRYFVMTGNRYADGFATIEPRQRKIDEIQSRYLSRPATVAVAPIASVTHAIPSDCALIERARAAKNGAAFVSLFEHGDTSGHSADHSNADAALCAMLAFWTCRDGARVDRLFRASKLMRDKWDVRHRSDGHTYGQMTIEFAISNCREVFDPAAIRPILVEMRSAITPMRVRDELDAEVDHYRISFRVAADAALSVGQMNGIRARVSRRLGIALPPIAVSA